MTDYKYDGIVIVKVAQEIRRQLETYAGILPEDLRVTRSFQPTKQAAGARQGSEKYQVFLSPIPAASQVGSGFTDKLNESDALEREHNTIRRVVYQIDTLADYDPSDMDSLESQDLCQMINEMIMQLDSIETLNAIGIRLENATLVRSSFSTTSENQYESTPNFDLTLTYNVKYIKEMATIVDINCDGIYGV